MIKTIRRGQFVPSIGIRTEEAYRLFERLRKLRKTIGACRKYVACYYAKLDGSLIGNLNGDIQPIYLKEKGNSSIEMIGRVCPFSYS